MGHRLVPADLQIRAVWQGDSTRWPEGTPFRRALIQVARLYPLPPSLGENLALPLFSQTFSSSTLPGTALSQEIVVVHLPSCICNPMDHSVPDLPVPHHFLKFAQVRVHCIGDAIQPPHSLSPFLLLLSILPSIRDFSSESAAHITCPIEWTFSFSINPSNKYSGLISLKIDWFDLLAVQGTFRRLHQHHNFKATILLCSAFFVVQFSQPYMTTWKTIALTI